MLPKLLRLNDKKLCHVSDNNTSLVMTLAALGYCSRYISDYLRCPEISDSSIFEL